MIFDFLWLKPFYQNFFVLSDVSSLITFITLNLCSATTNATPKLILVKVSR